MQREALPVHTRELSGSTLRRSVFLTSRHDLLKVDADGAASSLHSSRLRKLLFGRESVEAFKIQAGVTIPLRQRETRIRVSPESVVVLSAGQETLQSSHTLRLCGVQTTGYQRSTVYTNNGDVGLKLRVISLHDPTTLNFRSERDPPGDVGVNAFNRGDHVVMDDVGDTTGVRVIRFAPRPTAIYLTRSRQRATELLSLGELPESTAGMSGPILILSQHDVDLRPAGSFGVEMSSLYNDSSLEVALAESRQGPSGAPLRGGPGDGLTFACSSSTVSSAFAWARAAFGSVERESDAFERLSAGFGTSVFRGELFERDFADVKRAQRRDGLIPYSDATRGGPMETSLFLINSCGYLGLKGDRKLERKWYPSLKKAGRALSEAASQGLIAASSVSPDGWRRRLGSGFPTGLVSEVNLAASAALSHLSSLAGRLNKQGDSSAFAEASTKLRGSVDERLRDVETGSLALNLDPKGRMHAEATIDQAVALSYLSPDQSIAASTVRRLLEKDFETGFGPRTVSRDNLLYYSPDYGDGQLGGCWTRGTLAHAILAYASGQAAIGSAQLEKVSALVLSESEKMGGVPGEFPFWFDPERRQIGEAGSDRVAASRFVEAVLVGEAGLGTATGGPKFRPPSGSKLKWMMIKGLSLSDGSVFAGRSESNVFEATSLAGTPSDGALSFQRSERLEVAPPLCGVLFWDQTGMLACVGNSSDSSAADVLRLGVRGKPLSTALFVDVEEFNQLTWEWERLDRRKLLDKVELEVEMRPNSWRAYRVSQISRQR